MASKWSTSRALTAINNARADIAKRKEDEDFTYEPWAVPDAETQVNEAEAINQRYAQLQQSGPSAAVLAGRQAMSDYNAALKSTQETAQRQQAEEQKMLQNALTAGTLDSYKAYKNATAEQQAALENIYTAQNQMLTGYDRFMGSKTGTGSAGNLANQFKTDYGVSDDEYNSLMSGYKAYRSGQAANALASYGDISSEQRKALEKIRSLKTDGTANNTTVSGGDRYSGYKTQEASTSGTFAQTLKDHISGKTQKDKAEAESLKEQFKQKYGVDDATYSAWQAKYDEDQTAREEEAAAHKEGVRTQSQELQFANRKFSNATSKGDSTTWNQRTQALKQEIYDYLDQEDAAQTAEAMQYAETASNISNDGGKAQKQKLAQVKAAIQRKYNLSDEDFEDLKYYGQELYDSENRKKQQQEAYDNVHQDSTLKNIAGGLKNTASALVLNPYGGLGAIGETAKYNSGAYRDKQSPINVNSAAFAASNATGDYQGATQQALNDKNKILGVLYGAGMSAAESAETSILAGATGNRALASALSLTPFAANAYGNALSENISNDQRQSKAFENALTSATIETVTEIASADKFWDIFKNHNATARKRIIDFLVSSGIEGSEEVVGDIADNFMDAVVNGQNSEYNQNIRSYMMSGMSENEAKKQATKDSVASTVESFVSGALSGAMGAGIATAAGYANDVNTANNLFDGYTSKDYAEWADGLDTDPASYKNESAAQSAQKAKELATKMSQEQTPSKKEKLQLFEYYQDMQNVEAEAAAEEQEDIDRQKRWDSFTDKAKSVFGKSKTTTEEDIVRERADSAQESISAASNVPEEYRSEQNSTTYNDAYRQIQSATTQEELNEAIQTAKNSEEISWEDYEKLEQTAGSYAASKNNLDLEQAKVSKEDAYNAGYTGEEIGNVSADLQIAYNDGMKQAASDRAAQKAHNEELVSRAAEKQTNSGLGEIITSNYKDGMNARTYNEVMASAINAGRTGMSFEDYAKENGMSLAIVGEDLAKTAYSAGQKVAIEESLKEAARSLGEKTNVQAFGTGTFTDARTDKTENFQGAGVIEAMARMTGLDIVLTDQNFGTDDNGYYRSSNSTIYLNSNQADRVASTLFHEVGEFSSVWNQNEYASVVNDIMQASQKAIGSREFNRLRQKYVDAYQGETNKTDADIDKEMANDLLYQFLGNEKGMTKLMDQIDQNHGYKEAKSIKQRLADWVGHMVESIKNFISQLRPNSYQYKMATTNLQNYEELQNAIVKSIANAEQAYSDAKAARAEAREAKTIEEGKGAIEDYGMEDESTGAKRLSIETYEHGGREYLENYLSNTEDLTEEQKDDILDHMEWAYNLAKDLSKSKDYKFFGQWSQTGLVKGVDGIPLLETFYAGKPIQSVAVNNGEYPLNIDFSQVCKKRTTLNAVLNYLVDEYGLNLPTLTETDLNAINMEIKNHGFEIACGLCFVDAKRYRAGQWTASFTEGDYYKSGEKKGQLRSDKPGYNNLVRLITAKDKDADVGYSYFNYATDIPNTSEKTIDQLDDSELDFTKLVRKMGRFAHFDENGRVDSLRGYVDNSGKKKNPTETAKMAFAIYTDPQMRHLLAQEDILASEGLDTLRAKNKPLYNLVNAHWGTGKPKLPHGGTAYGNEILRSANWGSKNNFNAKAAYKVGGVRVQSFSDYEANMFFDYMQLFADMTARELPSHAYTKEAAYARLFGMAGQKINLSVVAKAAELTEDQQSRYKKLAKDGRKALLNDPEFRDIAEHAGLAKDENGNWTRLLVEDETFPLEEAKKIQNDPRYSSNCGIIWIGVSDAQIRVLLDSEDVPMVIPYHASGVSAFIKNARNLLLYKNYEDEQNTRNKSDRKKISGKDFDFYGSLARTNDPKATADEYKAWCEDHNYLPKFDEFKDHPNYYKLLVDFRVYDYNGIDPEKIANRKYLQQGAVSMTFPENGELKQLIKDSLADQQKTKDRLMDEMTSEQGSLISAIKDVIGLDDDGSRTAGEDVRYAHEIDDDVLEAAKLVYGGGKIDAPIVLDDTISNEFAHDVEQITGIDVSGFGNRFSQVGFEHIKKRHGVNGEQDRSMADPADVARVKYVLHNYDDMWLTKKKSKAFVDKFGKPAPTICIRKKIGDAFYYLIEAVPNTKARQLEVVSVYKNKKDTFHESADVTSPSNYVRNVSPTNVSDTSVSRSAADDKRSSRNIDSEDRELTTGQQKYFASSKLRDADGKLKVMYHGSTNAGFTTFDPQYSDDGISLFFTDSPRVAESYSGSDEEWRPDKHYSFDELSGMVDGYFAGDLQLIQNGDKVGLITVDGDVLYEGNLNGARDAFFDEIAEVPYDRGTANYKVYLNLENPYEFDANGRDWDELTEPRYASDVQHEYERLNVSHDAATDQYSLIGTDASGNKETIFENKTLSEIEEEYGANLREFMADTYYYKRFGTSVETSTYSDAGFDGEWSLMNNHLTTREIADYAKKNGYDGVIFKNIVDMGTYRRGHEASTVAIAFNSDQVKSVDNENPTTYADFRRAVGIDDTWSDDYDWTAEESKIQSGLAEALRSGNEILKGAEVNEANIRRIARQLKDQYGSRISIDELAENLTKVFAYAQKQDYINYNDLATVISEVAGPMIEEATVKTGTEEFKAFKNKLQEYTFNLDNRQQREVISAFGSWGAFRKALPGIKFTRDGSGVSLDGVWDTLVRESGFVLSRDVTSNDMPLELVDAYNAMKPTYENAFGEDALNATQDAAMEIVSKYYQYAAAEERNNLRKKQKKDLENLSKKIAQTNAEMRKQLQQKYNERLEKEIAKVKKESKPEKVSVQVARLRARTAKTVSSLREAQRRKEELRYLNKTAAQLVDWVTDPTDKNHIPKLLQTPVLQLMTSLDFVPQTVRETADGKYSIRILESRTMNEDGSYSYKWRTITADTVQGAVEQYKEAMNKFGLGSKQNRTWQENMEALHDLYQQNEEDDWYEKSELKQGLDKNLGEQLGEILRNNKGMMSIAELSSEELHVINDVMKNVMHAVRQVNRMYSQPSQQVSDVAHMVMDRANSGEVRGRQKHGKRMNGLIDTFTLDHATPVVYFHGVFGTDGIDPITRTMIKAQNQKARDVRQAQEYMEDVIEKAGMDKDSFQKAVEKWMYNATSKDHNTRNFYGLELTQTQIMSLYELMKRPDAQQHKVGGFIADETGRKSNGQKAIVHLTDEQIKTITDTLSEEQKQLADAMQKYLANECAKQGNETAMQLYGYEKYLDEHYFPMNTDSNTIATKDSNVTTGAINAIKNSGFTKKITPNATNALVLKDIFTVYADHVSQMATYHAWAAPLQDMIRWFNYNDKTVDNNGFVSRNSVKNAIDYFYGNGGQRYFTGLLSSINAKERSSFVGGNFYEALTGNAKAAAVMGNLRVVIQQPTAFMRAGEMIPYRYLKDGLEFKYAKEAAELRDRTSDVFWLKNQGNIDGYITQSMVSTITGVQTFKEKVNEKAGWAAGKADEVTWAAMYRAVYSEQVDKLGKNKVGTKEFEDAVNDRYSDMVLLTQVYDGIITRSQFMRSPDMANKMASAFMAEPVKTYNIVLWHMMDLAQANTEKAKKKAMKGLVKAGWVLTLTNAANAVAQSFWDAFRNAGSADDEDKDFLQRFMDALGLGAPEDEDEDTIWDAIKRFAGGNFVDNMDLLSNIPLVADYWDAVKSGISTSLLGESSYTSDSDLSMSGVSNFFKAVKAVVNPSDKMTAYGQFAAVARAFSDLTGLPVYAVQRDAVAIYNTLIGKTIESAPLLQKTTKYSPAQQAKLDVYSEALAGGDYKQAIEDAYNAGNSYKSIASSISKNCKEQYLELKETNPSEATQMKNRLAQMYVYLANKTGSYKDKTDAEKLKQYTKNIEKWGESEEEDTEE